MIAIGDEWGSSKPVGPGVVDNGEAASILSRTIDDAGVFFGKAVFRKPGTPLVSGLYAPVAFLGVSVSNRGVVPFPPSAWDAGGGVINDFYEGRSTLGVLTQGMIWILAGSDVTPGAKAYVTPHGAFSGIAAGNEAIRAVFWDARNAGELVRLRVG